MSGMECENCGEPIGSWDPLESHLWCDKCKMRAKQISDNARKELALFGEMLRKIRMEKEKNG